MQFQIPVPKRPVVLGFFLYSLLTVLLSLFCLSSAVSLMRVRSVDRLFHSLLTGTGLTEDQSVLAETLAPRDIDVVMSSWSDSRRKAAFLIMEYKGISYSGNPEIKDRTPEETLPDNGGYETVYDLMEAGSNQEAEALLLEQFESGFSGFTAGERDDFFLVLRDVVMKTGSADEWVGRLEPLEDESGFGYFFFLAGCSEKLKKWDVALRQYMKAGENSSDWEELRRSQWYTLRLMVREFPGLLTGFFDSSGILRNDGAYFDDVLDELFSILIRQRRWTELAALLPQIRKAGLTEAASQGLFLLEKGREEGYVTFSEPLTEASGFIPDPKGYYALRSRPESWPLMEGESDSVTVPGVDDMDEVYRILIDAGYQEEAYRLWEKTRETLSLETVKAFCGYLERKGDLYELISFAGFWYYAYPVQWSLELLPWVYPGSNRYSFDETSVPQELILGIIRRESAFHETIFSFAGAGGLMQLMPSTAEDLARKYRLENWNLLEADDNILLGTLYLQWLRDRPWTSSYVDVLAAYNGGGGNLRAWKRKMGYSDPDLFIQSIPFRETRDYVRKVIVAAASYRYLDTGTPPGEWLEQFYRSF